MRCREKSQEHKPQIIVKLQSKDLKKLSHENYDLDQYYPTIDDSKSIEIKWHRLPACRYPLLSWIPQTTPP